MSRRSGAVALGLSLAALAVAPVVGTAGASHVPSLPAATPTTSTGLPLYEFTSSGGGPLPWSAAGLSSLDGSATMSEGPESAQGPGGVDVVSFATPSGDVGVLDLGATSSYTNLTVADGLPAAADAPVPFFDALGRLNLAYATTSGEVVLATQNLDPDLTALGPASQFLHQPWLVSDLSDDSVTTAEPSGDLATGQVSAEAVGDDDVVALRTSAGALHVLTLTDQRPFNLVSDVVVASDVGSDPVLVGPVTNGVVRVATTAPDQHVMLYTASATGYAATDLTSLENTTPVAGDVAATDAASQIWVTGTARTNGDVELLSGTVSGTGGVTWTHANLTTLTADAPTPGPALTGYLAITVAGSSLSVAGQAAGWGDLFDYSNATGAWVATDVSVTGGSNAKTVGQQVTAVDPGGSVTLFAGGVSTPAPHGVGIYDIPSADLDHAVSDGWPILGDTGGLGTASSPWVATPSASQVASSVDFATGMAIQDSRVRETWLSFWTVSGPVPGTLDSPGAFEADAQAAGEAVATAIDRYRANGLGLKPDWVILDPEGYPDDHSQLDGFDIRSIVGNGHTVTVTTQSDTTLATGDTVQLAETGVAALNVSNAPITVTSPNSFTIASTVTVDLVASGTYGNVGLVVDGAILDHDWADLITGWRTGLAAVDPSLNPGLYTEESQYSGFDLSATSMPIFMAIAWAANGSSPTPINHSSNVLGFIEFGNTCDSSESTQLSMFDSAPWNGDYNTVQFAGSGYCTPSPS